MTKHPQNVGPAPPPASVAGAPEITPAMIERGVQAMCNLEAFDADRSHALPAEVVSAILRAALYGSDIET